MNPTGIRPLVTWLLIGLNAVIFFMVQPQDEVDGERFMYQHASIACEISTGYPLDFEEIIRGICLEGTMGDQPFPDKSVWASVLASLFLHAGFAHLLFNMWSLWIFGNNVEEAFGHIGYLLMYTAAGVAATLGFVALNADLTIPLVGASGAIAGVMGSYVVLFPNHLVMTLVIFRVVAIRAVWFLGLWFASQFLMAGEDSNIAWEAHVAGFIVGVLVTLPFRERLLDNTLERSLSPDRSRY